MCLVHHKHPCSLAWLVPHGMSHTWHVERPYTGCSLTLPRMRPVSNCFFSPKRRACMASMAAPSMNNCLIPELIRGSRMSSPTQKEPVPISKYMDGEDLECMG